MAARRRADSGGEIYAVRFVDTSLVFYRSWSWRPNQHLVVNQEQADAQARLRTQPDVIVCSQISQFL